MVNPIPVPDEIVRRLMRDEITRLYELPHVFDPSPDSTFCVVCSQHKRSPIHIKPKEPSNGR